MNNETNSENKNLVCVKTTRGITVVALVITIIIMLILAAITIGFVLNGSLFEKAKTATDKYTNSSEREKMQLNELLEDIEKNTKTEDNTGDPNASYQIGDEVIVGGERFYVLEPCSAEQTTVTLLSKYNLNLKGTVQVQNANYNDTWCNFSLDIYWKNEHNLYEDWETKLFDISTVEGKNIEGDAILKAKKYALLKGGTDGRFMTYEEVDALKDDYGDMIWGKANRQGSESSDYGLYYWLSSSIDYNVDHVWSVNGVDSELDDEQYCNYYYAILGCDYDKSFNGVRPVLTVSKTKVHKVE